MKNKLLRAIVQVVVTCGLCLGIALSVKGALHPSLTTVFGGSFSIAVAVAFLVSYIDTKKED